MNSGVGALSGQVQTLDLNFQRSSCDYTTFWNTSPGAHMIMVIQARFPARLLYGHCWFHIWAAGWQLRKSDKIHHKKYFKADVKCCSIDKRYMQIRTETGKANKWWLKLHSLYVRIEEEMATFLKLGHKTVVVDRNKHKCLFFCRTKFQ